MRAALAALLAAALLPGLAAPAVASPATPGPDLVYLILPFDNMAEDPSLDWLSTGLALSLSEYMLGLGAATMDDEERTVLLEGAGLPSGAPLTLASALELGRKMRERAGTARPNRLVLGRFNVADGEISLQVRSIDLVTDKAKPWFARQGRLKDLLEVQNNLFLSLAKEDGIHLPASRSAILDRQGGDLPLLAFETYCRAMAATGSKKRLQLLRRAVEQFPGYPKAAYQAAALLVKAERWDEAAAMLDKAAADPHPYESDFYLLTATVALQRRDPAAAATAAR
ncbi:MAG TPA: tetratricopeptide repeat protein, partial [Candidatus Polarisedimenticolia bacterium]|nr:tetratricopeptide repeat protein [Candidatus Polarisedimenticolia bacterium]